MEKSIVCGVDGSADSEAALAVAAGIADRLEPGLVPASVVERLADLADEENAERIVVGSRGPGAFKAAFLGSVSSRDFALDASGPAPQIGRRAS